MSEMSRWTYTNTALVRAVIGTDEFGGESFGPEFEIACTWVAENKPARTNPGGGSIAGIEFISAYVIYTEDARPQYGDSIKLAGHSEWQKILSKTEWDMSPFDDPEPDYKLIT